MPKKSGPPYLDDPECKFVVVENPWPGVGRDVVRNNTWFKQVAVWLRFALNQTAWPEFIYHRNTRGDLVVVQFPENVDITPLLGAHFWPNFFTPGGRPPAVKMSHIFEFNYRRHGHPETHQWSIYEVDTSPPPREWGPVPIKQPYPQPTWDSNAGRTSSDLTLPIPQPQAQPIPQQPPPPPQQPPAPQPAAQPPQARDPRRRSSLYTFADDLPDAPAPQPQAGAPGAGSSAPRDAPQPGSSQSLPQQRSPKLYEGKGDPYEEEEMASKALKSEPVEASVKPEPEPQDFSIGAAQLEALRQARAARASQSHTATTSPKSRTATAEPVPHGASTARSPSQLSGVVKHEPRDEISSAHVKPEPGTEVVSPGGHSRDPRAPVKVEQYAAQIPPRPVSSGGAPSRVKRELEEDGQADAKRPRTNTPPARN